MKKVLMTLGYLIKDNRVLLGYKKKGFGQGRWNGFGGKVEEGEDIKAATVREIIEECGVTPAGLDEGGVLVFKFRANPADIFEVHVFRTLDFNGEPVESDEMRPRWFEFENIPFTQMWDDDQYWLKKFLVSGKKVKAGFLLDEQDQVIEKNVEFY